AKVPESYGHWQWGGVQLPPRVSREEAHFWATALHEAGRKKPPTATYSSRTKDKPPETLRAVADQLAQRHFDGRPAPAAVKGFLALTTHTMISELVLPVLVSLHTPAQPVEFLLPA